MWFAYKPIVTSSSHIIFSHAAHSYTIVVSSVGAVTGPIVILVSDKCWIFFGCKTLKNWDSVCVAFTCLSTDDFIYFRISIYLRIFQSNSQVFSHAEKIFKENLRQERCAAEILALRPQSDACRERFSNHALLGTPGEHISGMQIECIHYIKL